MENVPFLVAGPIIRRTEPTQVTIWLATSERVQINGVLYEIEQKTNGNLNYQPLKILSVLESVRAGRKLYIHLLKISPHIKEEFPTDSLLGYNLYFNNHEKDFDLGSLQLLEKNNPHSIVYGNLDYPSFFIQKAKPTNILYGSCQKPHGKGDSAFTSADLRIHDNYFDLEKRPSALFLMGDQIYADDVGDPIFPLIVSWSEELIGEDKMALTNIEPQLNKEPFQSSMDKIQGREFIMENIAKFTSGNAANHLIRFGEYAIMYLLTMGPALWGIQQKESIIPPLNKLIKNDNYYFKHSTNTDSQDPYETELTQHQKRYHEQKEEIIPYLKTLSQLRRVLANTPTYMIFDDHDITDDWNLSFNWVKNVNRSSLGKNVVANGLSAYTLFQGWGNDPEKLESLVDELSDELDHYFLHSYFNKTWKDRILQFHDWSFVASTYPRTLFMDIRTMRGYDLSPQPERIWNKLNEAKRASQLISENGFELVERTLRKGDWNEGDPLIIVSPIPVYGIGIIQSFLRHFVYPIRTLGIPVQYALDFEGWQYNEQSFNNFLNYLTKWNPSQCIILSGDAHYACAIDSHITFNNQKELSIQQFTSSPIHNKSFRGLWGTLIKIPVWFHSFTKEYRTFYRSCDESYQFHFGKPNESSNKNVKWHEEITYFTNDSGSVIYTINNIGLLTLHKTKVEGKLLEINEGKSKSNVWKK